MQQSKLAKCLTPNGEENSYLLLTIPYFHFSQCALILMRMGGRKLFQIMPLLRKKLLFMGKVQVHLTNANASKFQIMRRVIV